jgi:hypothetical protein
MHMFKKAGSRIECRQAWRVELAYPVRIFVLLWIEVYFYSNITILSILNTFVLNRSSSILTEENRPQKCKQLVVTLCCLIIPPTCFDHTESSSGRSH